MEGNGRVLVGTCWAWKSFRTAIARTTRTAAGSTALTAAASSAPAAAASAGSARGGSSDCSSSKARTACRACTPLSVRDERESAGTAELAKGVPPGDLRGGKL